MRHSSSSIDTVHRPISIHALHTKCDSFDLSQLKYPSEYFNPRTSYEVRRIPEQESGVGVVISIHALHTKCDKFRREIRPPGQHFNPRTSYEVRRTPPVVDETGYYNFNPRTSYEVRHASARLDRPSQQFQSTHFIRSATTATIVQAENVRCISIHALHTKCDHMVKAVIDPQTGFQSTHFIRSATSV